MDEEENKESKVEETNKEVNNSNEEVNSDADSGKVINQDSQDNPNENGPESQSEELTKPEPTKEVKEAPREVEAISEPESKKEEPVNESPKEEPSIVPKSKEGKEGSWTPMIIIMGISLVIAFSWDKVDFIKNAVHTVLDPSAGALLTWNLTMGMLLIVLGINILTTVIQKYATDQEALRELKKEQKILQEEMKKYKDHPEKVAELSKKQLQFIPKTFKLTSRAVMFTGIPFILFFRWFNDVFTAMETTTGAPIKFLGLLSWFWFYLIFTMLFSTILRKVFKVV